MYPEGEAPVIISLITTVIATIVLHYMYVQLTERLSMSLIELLLRFKTSMLCANHYIIIVTESYKLNDPVKNITGLTRLESIVVISLSLKSMTFNMGQFISFSSVAMRLVCFRMSYM